MTRPLLILLMTAVAGCAQGEDTYPALVPVDQILADRPLSPDPAPALEARRAALDARADALRAAQP